MTRRTPCFAIITIALLSGFDVISSASSGYYYQHPIRPFTSPPFSPLRSSDPFSGFTFGQKVVNSPRTLIPPVPLTPVKSTRFLPTSLPKTRPSPATFSKQNQQLQQGQRQYPKPQQAQQKFVQLQKTQQSQLLKPVKPQFTLNQPQFPNTFQQRIGIQTSPKPTVSSTPRPTIRLTPSPTLTPIQRPTLRPTPKPFVTQRPTAILPIQPRANINIPKLPDPIEVPIPTTEASPINVPSTSTQVSVAADLNSPGVYVIDGRQLKQYQVYEEIDNDIGQEADHFIPGNFFVHANHGRMEPTHSVTESEDLQVENRFSRPRFQQSIQSRASQNQQPQQAANAIAIGSGSLGFVRSPSGNVYLGSGSLGYISNLQRGQDVEEARTRPGDLIPDSVHFGHGPLSRSFYYQQN